MTVDVFKYLERSYVTGKKDRRMRGDFSAKQVAAEEPIRWQDPCECGNRTVVRIQGRARCAGISGCCRDRGAW